MQFRHWSDREAYLADRNNWLIQDSELAAMMEPTRQNQSHINDCLLQVDDVIAQVIGYRSQLKQHIHGMEAEIKDHLWVSADFAAPAAEKLSQTQHQVETLLIRVNNIRDGFNLLPREADFSSPGAEPTKEEKDKDEEAAFQ